MPGSSAKIRLLHIITNLPVGGAQDNTLLTVERLDRRRFDVTLMCSSEGVWRRRADAIPNLSRIYVDELTRPIHLISDALAFWKIYRHLKRGRYDIVHTHSSKPGVLGRLAARLAGVPVVVHTIHGFPFHDFMNPLLMRAAMGLERVLARFTDRLITVSRLNLEKAVRLGLGKPEQFVNIYSGIDFDKFDVRVDPAAKKRELGLQNGEPLVGMVGRLSTQKAPQNFVRALARVLERRPEVRFVIVGDGELRDRVERLARRLGVESRLTILGYRDDVPELLPALDVYVLPSLWEGLGRSLTEAMYTGRPVVVTRVEGVPELVEDDRTGLLVEPNDVAALAEAILTLLTDREKAQRLGRAAQQRVTDAFRAEAMVQALERLYVETLAEKRGAHDHP